jgi:hypothetical protein
MFKMISIHPPRSDMHWEGFDTTYGIDFRIVLFNCIRLRKKFPLSKLSNGYNRDLVREVLIRCLSQVDKLL